MTQTMPIEQYVIIYVYTDTNNMEYIDCTKPTTNGNTQTQHYVVPDIDFCKMVDVYYHEEFPYPIYTAGELLKEWKDLCTGVSDTYRSRKGIRIVNMFHKSIWKARTGSRKLSPIEAWADKELLYDLYKNRLEYSTRKDFHKVPADYDYHPEYQESFDTVMRDGLTITKKGTKVSIFSPSVAKSIIHKYLPDMDVITDPFSGFSGRMLGVLSLGKGYVGRDINPEVVRESNNIIEWLGKDICDSMFCGPEIQAIVEIEDLREAPVRNVECIMTCPPYGLKEQWDGVDLADMTCDEWVDLVIEKYKAKRYVFVVDDHIEKYKKYIAESIINKSHFNTNAEHIVVINSSDL